jgi:hypothetical protein
MQQWSRRNLLFGGVGILLTGCMHAWAGDAPYSVDVQGEGNRVTIAPTVVVAAESYVATVTSPRGIGQATVAWWGDHTPRQLTFHLDLAGLESFELRWADTTVTVSASDQQMWQSVQKGESDMRTASPDSPFWIDITDTGVGYELRAPAAFLNDAPRLWSFAWIDFFR